MIDSGVNPKSEDVRVEFIALGRGKGMDDKIPVRSTRPLSSRRNLDSQSEAYAADLGAGFYTYMRAFIINESYRGLTFCKFILIHLRLEHRAGKNQNGKKIWKGAVLPDLDHSSLGYCFEL